MKAHLLLVLACGSSAAACGDRTPVLALACPAEPPLCVAAPDGCDPPRTLAPTCDEKATRWSCPSGSRVYARSTAETASCLPFHEPGGPVAQLGGSLVRVPVDGGRCLWVAETVLTSRGAKVRNVAFEDDRTAPFGSCPTRATLLGGEPVSALTIEGTSDPSLLVQIDGGYVLGGETHVLYRLFRTDPSETFGVRELGSGLGVWDATAQQIVVPGPDALEWTPSLDLGDAYRVEGGVPFVWGCHGPAHFLTDSCDLARLDGAGAAELFAGPRGWVPSARVASAVAVFDSGPWISSVVPSASVGFVHVYAVGFGSTLETHEAAAITGPWTSGPTLTACDLPVTDKHAFCAGPVVHEELDDPTRAGERVVSYGIGTTATNQDALLSAHPEEYWTRLAWTTSP